MSRSAIFSKTDLLFLISTIDTVAFLHSENVEILLAQYHLKKLGHRLLSKSNLLALQHRSFCRFAATEPERLALLVMSKNWFFQNHQGIELNLINKLINPNFYETKIQQKTTQKRSSQRTLR